MASSGQASLVPTRRDDAYTLSKHTIGGSQASKDARRGRAIHVFYEPADLDFLENQVWSQGTYVGQVGDGSRSSFDRFVWQSQTPVGLRIEHGKPDQDLTWVEIKG